MKERFWLKPTAIILGILAWMYVNVFSSSPIVRVFKAKINYLNIDTAKNYKIIPEAPEVIISVKGPRGDFIKTKVEENTFASVDLLNSHGGKLTLPVNVILPSNSNLTLVSKEPAQLVLNTVLMETRRIPVRVNKVGAVPEGYLNDEPRVSPDSLEVTAPAETINSIKECGIDIYLDKIKRSISEYRQTHIVYSDGKIETNLKDSLISIKENSVKLDIAVREGYPEKIVSVIPDLINKTPEGRKLQQTIALPEKVTITGPLRILDSIENIKLEQVDLSKVQKSSTLNVKPICPKGIEVVGNNFVALTIKYSDVPVIRTIGSLPLNIKAGEGQLAECDVSSFSIDIEGYIDDINQIKQDELKSLITISDTASGSQVIRIKAPEALLENIKVRAIRPDSVLVKISSIKNDSVSDNYADTKVIKEKTQNTKESEISEYSLPKDSINASDTALSKDSL